MRGEDVAKRRVLAAGYHDGKLCARGRQEPALVGVPLVQIDRQRFDQFVEVFVPEAALLLLGGALPHGDDELLYGAKCLVFGDAGVGHPAHPLIENPRIVLLGEIAILGKSW